MLRPLIHTAGGALMALALGCGSSHDATTEPEGPLVHLVGQILLGTGASAVPALRVTVRSTADPTRHAASASADATGAFALDAPIGSWGALDLIVDAPPGTRRLVHPLLTHATADVAGGLLSRPLVVPESATFASADFGTRTIPFSTRDAFAAVCTDTSNANCNSFYPASWRTRTPELWPVTDLPVPVAFNRVASNGTVTDADSIAVWQIIGKMQNDLGRPLFRPATFESLAPPNDSGYSRGAVLISIDNTLAPTAGYTNWFYDGQGNIFQARTRVGSESALARSGLITHELLHALGFHHTCAWPSVMGGYGCALLGGATIQDAAAFNLAFALRATILNQPPSTKLGDVLFGEQQLETSLVASRVPAATRVAVPFAPADHRTVLVNGRLAVGEGAP
jgi:hypothetical protein